MSKNWSESEVEACVEDYFDMLRLELSGQSYNKSEHRRALMERLSSRSHGSVELKHQNISAVLIEMGIPYIDGYKPRSNYQRTVLPGAISNFLLHHKEFHQLFENNSDLAPEAPAVQDLLATLERAPQLGNVKPNSVAEPIAIYNPVGVNYLEKEAQNQILGNAGELFVINFERARLIHAGKENLAGRIEQVSETVGPAAGYDVRSFEINGTDRFIEAKTTKHGKNTPFFVTPNELRFSGQNRNRYFLYRVFKFGAEPRLFTLNGFLKDQCMIKPSQYLARPK